MSKISAINNSFEIIIGEDKVHQRLDKALSAHPFFSSRTQAAMLIDSGHVLLNGKKIKSSHKVALGDRLIVTIPEKQDLATLQPFNLSLDIPYEDEDILVVNKPSGLVVHPSYGHAQDTLVNALIHHTKNLSMGFNEKRPGIVHRLDRETSGLLVVAKNNFAHEFLAQQFQHRQVHRRYWAIVWGNMSEDQQRIETFIARHPQDRKRFSSKVSQGKVAITNFKVLERVHKKFSLLELRLETGRTHQIRVHLSDLGHPIVGDKIYGSDKRLSGLSSADKKNKIKTFLRIALHAKELGFVHPKTREQMNFTSNLPNDFFQLSLALGFEYVRS